MFRNNTIVSIKNFQLKVLLILFLFSFSNSWGQTTIWGLYSGGSAPAGWTFSNNVSTNAIDQTSYWLVDAGNPSDRITTSSYDLCAYSSATVCLQVATFGSGANNPAKIEVSYDGGATYTDIFTTTTPTSSTYNSLECYTLSQVSTQVVIRISNNGSSGRGVRIKNYSLSASGSGGCCIAPTTTITPTSQTVCTGSITTISVSSSASSPSYTWQSSSTSGGTYTTISNGTPTGASYSGINTAVLTVTAGSTYYYRCLVAEGGTCTATSGTSTLVVNTTPTITTQPVNKTICSGSNTSFTVVAGGSPLTYQWQENSGSGYTNITNGGIYNGATSATLSLTNPGVGMNTYSYQCIVSVASCASATTSAAILTINTTPAAPPAPTVPSNPACTTGTFSAMTSTVAGVTWYWQTSSTGVSTSSPTATNYTTSSTATIYVRALESTGTCWSASSSASVTVNSPASITTQPTDKEVCMVGNTTFAVVGTGSAPKQWQYSSDGGVTFTNVPVDAVHSNVTNATMNLTGPTTALNGYVYQCVISVAGCPVVTTNTVLLSVYATPAAPPTPTALANPACSGTSLAAMTSTVAGVTWYWQGTNSAGTSTTNPTSLLYNITSSGTYYVRARVDGSSCLSTSSSTAITINTPPTVVVQPVDKTQCAGTNTTFSVSASGTSLTYVWQYNTGSGFVNVPNSAPYSNVTSATMSITNITAGMNGYQYQCIVSGASPCPLTTSNFASLIITGAGAPTLAASSPVTNAIACNAFNLSWINGNGSNRLVVVSTSPVAGAPVNGTSYLANSTFGLGGTIAAGEFVVYKGSGSSVFITGLAASTTYYYKIFEFNGCSIDYLTSGIIPNGNVTTTNCSSTPGATAVYIDACPGGCGYEGNNELIWGSTGSYALYANSTGPTVHYGSITTPTFTQISSYGTNASAITALNASVGSCTNTVFVDPTTLGYIPANSNFLIANTCICNPTPYDFSGLCNSGPIYVIFGTGPAWDCNTTGGIFGNSGSGLKYFDLDFTSMGVSLDPIYNFNSSNLVTGNGAAVTLNPNGGAATSYFNNGCAIPLTVLPIELIDFYATQDGVKNNLVWKVASEKNISQYTIEKSADGIKFKEMTRVNSQQKEGEEMIYFVEDEDPYSEITYYRLSTVENNGKTNHHKIIGIDRGNKDWNSLLYQNDNYLIVEFKNLIPKDGQVILFDLSGKQIIEQNINQLQTKVSTATLSTGIYFVKILTPYKTENFKIIIQNDK